MSQAPSFPGVRVVGMHFRGAEAKEYCAALQPGDALSLKREPENPYDQNAIMVLASEGSNFHLGYLERTQAAWISGWMDEGNSYNCTVVDLLTGKNNVHPIVDLEPVE